jgi:transcriptional regulator with XRE-family HTH domain
VRAGSRNDQADARFVLEILQTLQYPVRMDSAPLQDARRVAGLTQREAARRLGVSQPYLSQIEGGTRALTPALARKAARLYDLSPTALPLPDGPGTVDSDRLARDLAALGYPRFAHVRGARARNPALVLLAALALPELDPRVLEALPWLIRTHPDLDWNWLLPRVKVADLQNRLGFLVALARETATADTARELAKVEARLEPSRLVRVDLLGFDSMPQAERDYRKTRRSALAARWNVLSTLTAEQLRSA